MIKYFRFIRSFFFTLRILFFYILIAIVKKVIPDHWFDKLLHSSNLFVAKRIKLYIFRLRGIFIKLGQFMGVMSNLFYPEIAKELEALQDSVPPVSYEVIKKRFTQEFNQNPEELFLEFSKTPLASASLGQVHVAVTQSGKEVCVKVLYPGMEELVRKDLKSIKAILHLIHLFFPFFDLDLIYREFSETVQNEMDYVQEHQNLEEIKKNFLNEPDIIFPEVMGDLSSKAVLTTEMIHGIKINRIEELEAKGIDSTEVAKLLIKAYCKMIFVDQKYHSDPHPGNIFVVLEDKIKIAFIDFGSVEIFSDRFKRNFPPLVRAIIEKRIPSIVDNMEALGFVTRMADRDEIENVIGYRYDKIESLKITDYRKLKIKDFADIDAFKKLDLKLGELMKSFQVPSNYMYLWRTIALLMGLAAQLDPKVNVFQIAWPYLEEYLLGKDKTFADFIKTDLKNLAQDVLSLPEYTLKSLEIINHGKFKIQIRDLNKNVKIIYLLGHQFIYTLLLITSATFALVLDINDRGFYSELFIYLAGFFAFILMVSFCKHRKFKR